MKPEWWLSCEQWAGGGPLIQLCNPGPFSHYWIKNETTFWNDPPRWPWAARRFPPQFVFISNCAEARPAVTSHYIKMACKGAQHLIPPPWSTEGKEVKQTGWNRQGEVGGEPAEYEYWMLNVISFIRARVSTLQRGYRWQKRFKRGPAAPLTTPAWPLHPNWCSTCVVYNYYLTVQS